MIKLSILLVSIYLILGSCSTNKDNMFANDVQLFKVTAAWELAKAVNDNDVGLIKSILLKNSSLINYQENKYKQSLLEWAVYTNHFNSARTLAEFGANPNLPSNIGTAFIRAADKNSTSHYIRLLLKYNGNFNPVFIKEDKQITTPLIKASFNRLESVKLLVDAGADINYISPNYECALKSACLGDKIDIIRYLIIEKNANYKRAIGYRANGDSSYVHQWIERMDFHDNPEADKMRQEVLEYIQSENK